MECMILFSFSPYENIARELTTLPAVEAGTFTIRRYDNQELNAHVQGSVTGKHCLILGSIAPPDETLLSLTLLAHTLKKEGADHVTALLPYLAYTRQDKTKPGESLGVAWMGTLLKSSGIDQVLTLDVHSERDKELFPIPLISLSTDMLFADAIAKHGLRDATIVAPDNGALVRCEAIKRAAAIPSVETPYFEKKRTDKGIVHHGPIGKVGTKAVIVDDMLDTGGTLISACEKLRTVGVQEIYIFVTHGLFTGKSWRQLWSLGVNRIFCTDTVPIGADIDQANITRLPVAPLIRNSLRALEKGKRIAVRQP